MNGTLLQPQQILRTIRQAKTASELELCEGHIRHFIKDKAPHHNPDDLLPEVNQLVGALMERFTENLPRFQKRRNAPC